MSSSEAIAAKRPSRPHSLTLSSRFFSRPLEPDRELDAPIGQGIEQLAHPIEQANLPAHHIAVALFFEIGIALYFQIAEFFAEQAAEDAGIGHAERGVDEVRREAQFCPPLDSSHACSWKLNESTRTPS